MSLFMNPKDYLSECSKKPGWLVFFVCLWVCFFFCMLWLRSLFSTSLPFSKKNLMDGLQSEIAKPCHHSVGNEETEHEASWWHSWGRSCLSSILIWVPSCQVWKVQQEASRVKPAHGDVLLSLSLIPCRRHGIKVCAAATTSLLRVAWCRELRKGLISSALQSGAAMLVQTVRLAWGCDSLQSLCAGSAGAGSCSLLSCPFMGVHLGVSCFKLCWMHLFVCIYLSAMLGEHLLLEQMMVGCLLSDMWSCL